MFDKDYLAVGWNVIKYLYRSVVTSSEDGHVHLRDN
jgi:hypothetical protein